jgi:hypothetical protein
LQDFGFINVDTAGNVHIPKEIADIMAGRLRALDL